MWWMWMASAGMAADFYLEGPHLADRSEAVRMMRQVGTDGRARVVKRFLEEGGWAYLVRVEGYAEQRAALQAAERLTVLVGSGFDVLRSDGQGVTYVSHVDPRDQQTVAVPEAVLDEEPRSQTEAAQWLSRAAAAHGVGPDTLTAWMSGPTLLRLRRTLPDDLVVEQTFAAREGGVLVEVVPVRGQATASRLFVRGDEAWLAVDGGSWQRTDRQRAGAVVADFSPVAVVPFLFTLGRAPQAPDLQTLRVVGRSDVGGVPTVLLERDAGGGLTSLSIEVGEGDGLVRRVTLGESDVEHVFADFAEHDGVTLPSVVETQRGHRRSTVRLLEARRGDDVFDDASELGPR
ncbi:MAG: hypothetical protein KTR31_14035 [Myxococcales bacterium]|nr:hypothetical protein [Myxococcales bacterium]